MGCHSLLQGIFPTQGSNTGPTMQGYSLLTEPQRKPKNIGERSLSLLRRISPTQELNSRLLHCRQTLYHLSHQGSSAAAAKWLQSCLTLCDPIDGSPPGSTIPRILQARTLEWVAISFSREALSTSYQRSISRTSGLRCRLSISIYSFFQTLY